jgi:glycosyltransferase involved in cell wall biosynthesis
VHSGGLLVRTADVLVFRALPFRRRIVTVQAPVDWHIYDEPTPHQRRWRRAASHFDAVVAPSLAAAAIQRAAGIQRVLTVHNPVEVDAIAAGDGGPVRNELRLDRSQLLVLFMARLADEKRPMDVVEAFAEISRTAPNVHLAVAGDGACRDECARQVERTCPPGRVHLLGHRSDVANVLKAADIFVHPSLHESFGMAVVEAMAAGVPVITTSVGIVAESAQVRDAVRLVDRKKPAEVAAALHDLIASPATRRLLSGRGQEAAGRFAAASIASEYMRIYRSSRRDIRPGTLRAAT